MIKYIHIDYRRPRTKAEKRLFALSNVDTNSTDMFINTNKHRRGANLIDTFFHEMAHVFLAFHGKDKQMTDAKEEELATHVGRICAEALK